MSKHNISRRKFVGSMPCLALGTTTLFSSLISLKAMNTLISNTTLVGGDYKAIVCVLLGGGNDSFNMVVPRGNTEYSEYAAVRSTSALPQDELLAINPNTSDGRQYGLHPSMHRLQQLFEQGHAAVISNVGTLVEPTTKAGIESQNNKLPLGLLSHSDQVMHWQTAFPQDRVSMGWGGKMADILKAQNLDNGVSMNISIGGNNVFQRGESVVEFAINSDGGVAIQGWNLPTPFFNLMKEDVTDMMNHNYAELFKDSYKGVLKRSVDGNEVFNEALFGTPDLMTLFSSGAGNGFSQDLRMVAQTIAARQALGAKRQIFFVQLGGFDNHDELLTKHSTLMDKLDRGLSEFYAATEELGVSDCVTTYTISDFARTLTSNGNGTDHAWGGNAIVMGGAVKGKEMYGQYPIIGLGTDIELGGGVLIPTTSADQYFAEIALWFGISPNDLQTVLPNIGNFYDVNSGQAPLGFLL